MSTSKTTPMESAAVTSESSVTYSMTESTKTTTAKT